MAAYLKDAFGIPLQDAFALAWSGVSDSDAYNSKIDPDTEYTMSDGTKITKGDIDRLSGAYKTDNTEPTAKGKPICN